MSINPDDLSPGPAPGHMPGLSGYVSPEPDANFPDRPTHQDWIDLSYAVQTNDLRADAGEEAEAILGLDEKSLWYLLDGRIMRSAAMLGVSIAQGDRTYRLMMASYMDGLAIGKTLAERRAARGS